MDAIIQQLIAPTPFIADWQRFLVGSKRLLGTLRATEDSGIGSGMSAARRHSATDTR